MGEGGVGSIPGSIPALEAPPPSLKSCISSRRTEAAGLPGPRSFGPDKAAAIGLERVRASAIYSRSMYGDRSWTESQKQRKGKREREREQKQKTQMESKAPQTTLFSDERYKTIGYILSPHIVPLSAYIGHPNP